MKKDKRKKKNKQKSQKGITAYKKEAFFEYKKIPEFDNGESYYIYNLAHEATKNKKTVIAEINGSENSIIELFLKGLKDNGVLDITFYSIDCVFADELKKQNFLHTLENKGITGPQIKINLLSDKDAIAQINDKTIDILFINENGGSIYNDLSIWYPKLKDDGWFSGYVSFIKNYELEKFVVERDLGYVVISMPHSKEIFEIYSENATSGLRRIKEFLESGTFGDARNTAKLLMLQYPHSPFITNLKAELDYQCGLTNEARLLFKKIVDAWPYYVRALNNLGAIEANSGNVNHARTIFRKILEIDPYNIDAKRNLEQIKG